jgi:hypothetical protein
MLEAMQGSQTLKLHNMATKHKPLKTFYQSVNKRSRKAMVEFLQGHFRYNTMNPWNQSDSYANRVKVYNVIPHELRNKVFELMEADSDGFYIPINDILSNWEAENKPYSAGFNGRSSGYIVMYYDNYPGRPIDMNEDFADKYQWPLDALKSRVELVQSFDKMCDAVVLEAIYMAENASIEIEEYTVTKTRKHINY